MTATCVVTTGLSRICLCICTSWSLMLPPDIGRSKSHIFLLCEFYIELIIIMTKVRLPDLIGVLLHDYNISRQGNSSTKRNGFPLILWVIWQLPLWTLKQDMKGITWVQSEFTVLRSWVKNIDTPQWSTVSGKILAFQAPLFESRSSNITKIEGNTGIW